MTNPGSKTMHFVARLEQIPDHGCYIVRVNEVEIGLFRIEHEIHAYRNGCPHAGAPVCKGLITGTRLPSAVYEYTYGKDREILRCPWHGWEFDLRTGQHLAQEHVKLRAYKVVIQDECVYIML